ncbi:hypothetical protein [Streptomyces sp. NPDC006134]|uniref:hypothetical protein n=1 Tax=Streptomyces sp. NPDC006134 TaxID=3154467 RepID=UPI0033CDA4B5
MAMPRPTVAQLAYGSCTVIFSTLAMLLLSQAAWDEDGAPAWAVAVIAVVALGLGVLVALTAPPPTARRAAVERPVPPEPVTASAVSRSAGGPVRERASS